MRFLKEESISQGRYRIPLSLHGDADMLVIGLLILPLCFLFLDHAVVIWLKDVHQTTPPFYAFLQVANPVIDFFGNGLTLVVLSLILFGTGRYRNTCLQDVGKSLIIGFLSGGIAVQTLKHLIGRARPRVSEDLLLIGPSFKSGYDSFPSGHTTVVFCLAYILSYYFPSQRWAFYLFALVVALERIGDIAHFPSDIVGGAILGTLVAKILMARIVPSRDSTLCQR